MVRVLRGHTILATDAHFNYVAGSHADEGRFRESWAPLAISGRILASLEMVVEKLASCAGGRPAIVVGDVGAKGGPSQIAAEAATALGGRIDILVNNAGAARPINQGLRR